MWLTQGYVSFSPAGIDRYPQAGANNYVHAVVSSGKSARVILVVDGECRKEAIFSRSKSPIMAFLKALGEIFPDQCAEYRRLVNPDMPFEELTRSLIVQALRTCLAGRFPAANVIPLMRAAA